MCLAYIRTWRDVWWHMWCFSCSLLERQRLHKMLSWFSWTLSPPSHPQCLTMWFRQRHTQFWISVLNGLRDVMWPTAFSTDGKWSCRFERIRCIWTSDAIAVPCKTEGFRCVDCRKRAIFSYSSFYNELVAFHTTNGQL